MSFQAALDIKKQDVVKYSLGEVEQKICLKSDQQIVLLVQVAQGKCFEARQQAGREETVTIVKGEGRYVIDDESKTITPITLIKLTASKVCQIVNDHQETLMLYFVSVPSNNQSEEPYVRNREHCYEIKTGTNERIYELFGIYGNGPSVSHSVALVDVGPGGGSQEHYHPKVDESYFMIQGSAKLTIEEKVTELNGYDSASVPVGKKHQISNIGSRNLIFLAIVTPPWTQDCGIYTPTK
jgi:mannose-6-phosphate isomerase-like protein (cupin superfamily)